MARKRKPGPRTPSGRLSRAYKSPELRDKGTPEVQDKRAYLINGSDPQLAATASGILLANGFLTHEQHAAAMRYSWAHALTCGRPLAPSPPARGTGRRPDPADDLLERARQRLQAMDARLTSEQRQPVGNVAVSGLCLSGSSRFA